MRMLLRAIAMKARDNAFSRSNAREQRSSIVFGTLRAKVRSRFLSVRPARTDERQDDSHRQTSGRFAPTDDSGDRTDCASRRSHRQRDTRSLARDIEAIGREPGRRVDHSARPPDFKALDTRRLAEPEVRARVAV